MDIENENDPEYRLEQILGKKSGRRASLLFHRSSNYLLYRATSPKVSCCVAFKEKPKEKNPYVSASSYRKVRP